MGEFASQLEAMELMEGLLGSFVEARIRVRAASRLREEWAVLYDWDTESAQVGTRLRNERDGSLWTLRAFMSMRQALWSLPGPSAILAADEDGSELADGDVLRIVEA